MNKLRFWIKKLHLYIALLSSIPLIIISLTGAVLVYQDPIDRWINPELLEVEVSEPTLPLDTIVQKVKAAFPKEKISGFSVPAEKGHTYSFWTSDENWSVIYIDPYTGQIKGQRYWKEWSFRNFIYILFDIHLSLKAGETGSKIVGIAALILGFSILTGLFLWLPKTLSSLRHKLKLKVAKRWKQTAYNWHATLGFYFSAALMSIILTGVSMTFSGVARKIIYWMTVSEAPVEQKDTPPMPDKVRLSYEELSNRAQTFLAERYQLHPKFSGIDFETEKNAAVTVSFQGKPALNRVEGYQITMNSYDGQIVSEKIPQKLDRGTTVLAWIIPVHFGTWGDYFHPVVGFITRFLWVFAALMPFFLIISGFTFWKKPKWLKLRIKGN